MTLTYDDSGGKLNFKKAHTLILISIFSYCFKEEVEEEEKNQSQRHNNFKVKWKDDGKYRTWQILCNLLILLLFLYVPVPHHHVHTLSTRA